MEGGTKRPREGPDVDKSSANGKKIKQELINLTAENVNVSHGIERNMVLTGDVPENEVGCVSKGHVENGAVQTSMKPKHLTKNAGNGATPQIKNETMKDNSLAMESRSTENSEEESERKLLREDIQKWLAQYEVISEENVAACLKDLRDVRLKRDKVCHLWQSDVLYIREVQKRIKCVVDKLATADQKKELVELLKGILHPWDVLQEKYFPNIRDILANALDEEVSRKEPFPIRHIKQLPVVLKKVIKSVVSDEERTGQDITNIQEQLEVTMEEHSEYADSKYEYLLFVGVLQLFSWIPRKFMFEYKLTNWDLDKMLKMLEAHLKNMESVHNDVQIQAYILNLTLCRTWERSSAVQYVAEKLSTVLNEQFREACQTVCVKADVTDLQSITYKYLRNADRKLMAKSLLYNIKSQLRLLNQQQRLLKDTGTVDFTGKKVSSSVETLLDNLDMKKYYAQGLRYEDVIQVKSDVNDSVNKRPGTLEEFPWYFLKHIIGLDSDTRENCHKTYTDDDEVGDSSGSEDDSIGDIHPLDLI